MTSRRFEIAGGTSENKGKRGRSDSSLDLQTGGVMNGLKLCCHLLGHRVKLIMVLDRVEVFVRVLLAQSLLPLQT